MTVCTCPDRERLCLYVRGCLDSTVHDAVERHLDECPACWREVETLDGLTPTPIPHSRLPVTEGPPTDEPLRQLIASVKAMGGLGSTAQLWVEPPAEEFPRGTVLGNYELLEPLGAGGMGRVFKAWHRRLKREVALKVLAPELLRSEAARVRFRREMEAAARVASPHVVAVHDAGEEAGRDFLVMEFVEGHTLADLVKDRGPLPVGEAVRAALQAARGLAHAHAAGLIHRDVKPANLLLDRAGQVKVSDLGLARGVDAAGDGNVTASGVVVGTASCMAPEQAFDSRRVDHRADVYGLGCTLYFLLTGKPPYVEPTALETLLAHRERPIPSVRDGRPDCPPALDALLRAMLAKRPEDRPADMNAVITGLEATAAEVAPADPTRPRWRKRRFLAAAAVLAAAVLAAVAVLRPWEQGPSTRPAPERPEPIASTLPTAREAGPRPAPARVPDTPPPKIKPKAVPGDWVLVKAGTFRMGSPSSDPDVADDEKPRHEVHITRPFFLHRTKVTQEEYEAVTGTNPSTFSSKGRSNGKVPADTRRHPVESISWLDAVRFCNARSERDGLPPYYRIEGNDVSVRGGPGYRLPTEAEWEYACRGGTETRWSFGDNAADLDAHAWHAGNSGGTTHPVGLKKPNPLGLLDMHGNVPEWCWDRYAADAYKHARSSDPVEAGDGRTRVHRGGAWDDAPAQTRSASRRSLGTSYSMLTVVGLRLARDAQP
jgi:formylglycine-generating enzyme required for sulfatase activity